MHALSPATGRPVAVPDAIAVSDALAVLSHPHPLRPMHRSILVVYALRGGGRQAVRLRSCRLAMSLNIPDGTFERAVQRLTVEGWLVKADRDGPAHYRLAPAVIGQGPKEAAWEEALAACGLLPAPAPDPATQGLPARVLSALESWESVPHVRRNVLLLYALLGGFTGAVQERANVLAPRCGLLPPGFSRAVTALAEEGWLVVQQEAGRRCYRLSLRPAGSAG